MRHRAMTLLELLVAIAIIAILAALVFPVIVKSRERARRVSCVGNLRQIGMAIQAYTADYGERYPSAYDGARALLLHKSPSLMETLNGYVGDRRVWACPSDTGETDPQDPSGFGRPTAPFDRLFGASYDWPGYGWEEMPPLAGRPAAAAHQPSITPLQWEARPWHRGCKPNIPSWRDDHISTYNFLYCDGHTAVRTAPQMLHDMAEAFPR
ncbi:MAG TPA: DUF1559 domain-containing protein [Armatimonadota bacterium]